ncbi:MAG: TatD family hydrolase [Planctomycetota bacterium]
MLFDSHAHLDDDAFSADLEQVLARAKEAGVERILTVGTNLDSSKRACAIAAAHEGVDAAVGIHPHEADSAASIEELRPLLPRAVAVGETGLDYAKGYSDPANQKKLFIEHMALAKETGLPIVLHFREAHRDGRAMLREHLGGPIRGVAHCFSGSAGDARDYLDLGLHISIAGPVTYPNAHRLREVAATIPLDRLLVETDCPYLAPQSRRGKRNEPACVAEIAGRLAEVFRVPIEKLAEKTFCSAQALFARS